MRASRIAIAVWTLLFALLVVGVLALRIHRAARDAAIAVAPAADPHDLPMDYADRDTRAALNAFETFTLGNDLDSLALRCREDVEIYRTTQSPGLADGDFTGLELSVGKDTANLRTMKFDRLGPGGDDYGWHVVSNRTVDADEVRSIQSAADSLLNARLKVADARIIDAGGLTAETCRHDRYHFFLRHGAGRNDVPFATFIAAMRAISPSESGRPAKK